jgi:hypothetical protein
VEPKQEGLGDVQEIHTKDKINNWGTDENIKV